MLGMASLKMTSPSVIPLILIAASAPKKMSLEDAKPGPEAVRTVECNKGLSLEPGAQLEEKKTSEISLSNQHSSELEKRPDAETVVAEGREAGQMESSGLQESPRARAEAVLLPEMVRCIHCPVQPVGPSLSQGLLV